MNFIGKLALNAALLFIGFWIGFVSDSLSLYHAEGYVSYIALSIIGALPVLILYGAFKRMRS